MYKYKSIPADIPADVRVFPLSTNLLFSDTIAADAITAISSRTSWCVIYSRLYSLSSSVTEKESSEMFSSYPDQRACRNDNPDRDEYSAL